MDGIEIRRAEFEDARDFNFLISGLGGQPLFRAWFGQFNFPSLIEYSHYSIIAYAGKENCIGYMSLNDSSNSTDLQSFESVLDCLRIFFPCKTTNTLFINFWALDSRNARVEEVGSKMFREAFATFAELDYISWCCPATAKIPEFIGKYFVEVDVSKRGKIPASDPLKGMKVLYVHRSKFLPQLLVRDAKVEDNDDLLPILEANDPEFVDTQDEFFLADMIQKQDTRNRFFVGVNEFQKPIGILATSLDVNVELISTVFDLESFSDIIYHNDEQIEVKPMITLLTGYPNLLQLVPLAEIAFNTNYIHVDVEAIIQKLESYESYELSDIINEIVNEINILSQSQNQTNNSGNNNNNNSSTLSILLSGFPKTEVEAKALLESSIIINSVLEVIPGLDEVELEDDDATEDLLDTIELLRHLSGTEMQKEEQQRGVNTDFNASISGNFPKFRPLWRKAVVEDSNDSNEAFNIVVNELRDIQEILTSVDADDRQNDVVENNANAFVVTIFCIESSYASRSEDLLRMAFEENPTVDYCLFMLPNNHPVTPLTRWMTHIRLQSGVCFDQTLHVIHRQALSANTHLSVVRMTTSHRIAVDEFLRGLGEGSDEIFKATTHSLRDNDVELKDNPAETTFVAMLHQEIVGVMVLSRRQTTTDDVTWIRANYLIDDLVVFDRHRGRSQAMITHWAINPIFGKWCRFMIREVMRMYYKTLLYYQTSKYSGPPMELPVELIPVRPRNRIISNTPGGSEFIQRPTPYADGLESPLYFITKKYISESKTMVHTRVVVVGGSSSTFSLLETLCFVPYLHLTSIFLILEKAPKPWRPEAATRPTTSSTVKSRERYEEKNGDNDNSKETEQQQQQNTTKPIANDFENRSIGLTGPLSPVAEDEHTLGELYALGLANRVTLVVGRLQNIDRENKAVVLSDQTVVEYDVLILSSGMQDASNRQFDHYSSKSPRRCAELGFFCLGSPIAESQAIHWIKNQHKASPNKDRNTIVNQGIVLYGCGTESLVALGQLLKEGVDPQRILWVIPKKRAMDLGHESIDDVAGLGLQDSKIKVLKECVISHISRTESGYIQSITVERGDDAPHNRSTTSAGSTKESDSMSVVIECGTLLTSTALHCDIDLFDAIDDCGLVYDGGVVVDMDFRTVDPLIYAMGSFTRYSRIYKDASPHNRFNPREVGAIVAMGILDRHLDPKSASSREQLNAQPSAKLSFNGSRSITHYGSGSVSGGGGGGGTIPLPPISQSKTISAILPGGLFYVRSSIPSAGNEKDHTTMTTGDASTDRVCVVQTDPFGIVVEIVCIGTTPFNGRYLGRLVGWHESYLNSALYAYECGLVVDWITFFEEAWASVVLHDKFTNFVTVLRDSLKDDKGMATIIENVIDVSETTDEDGLVVGERRRLVGDRARDVSDVTKKIVEGQTLEFLRKNKSLLVRFHVPMPGAGKVTFNAEKDDKKKSKK